MDPQIPVGVEDNFGRQMVEFVETQWRPQVLFVAILLEEACFILPCSHVNLLLYD